AVVADAAACADDDGDLERIGLRRDRQGPQPPAFLLEPHAGHDARRPRRALGVAAEQPLRELRLEIAPIVKASTLEEAALDPADEVLASALLIVRARPAELRREAIVERDLAEDGIPDDQITFAPLDDGLGIVPDRDERDPAEALQRGEKRADQRLFALIGDKQHVCEPAPLQPTGEEMH